MEIRILTDAEREEYIHLLSVAFAMPMSHPQMQRNKADALKYTIWGVFEEQKLLCATMVYFLTCNLDGTFCKLLGIGGVVTYPEARRKGAVRRLMKVVLETYRQEGYLFSGLIPFDHAFYRKFGYESSFVHKTYDIPLPELSGLPQPARVRMVNDPNDTAEAQAVYDVFAAGLNQTVGRGSEPMGFTQVFGGDTYEDGIYRYILYGAEEKPEAYVSFTADTSEGERILAVNEMAWIDRDALWKGFGFLSTFYSHYQKVRIKVPTDVRLEMLVARPRTIRENQRYNYMMRVLNVEAAATNLRAPRFAGSFNLEITDPFLPENEGVYRFAWEQNGRVSCNRTEETPDGRMSVSAFLTVLMGVLSMEEALYRPDVQISSSLEDMKLLFTRRPQYKREDF